MSWNLVKYVLTASVRDRLLVSLALVLVVASCVSVFLGSSAVAEKASFALVFAAGGLRVAGTFGLVLFVIFFIRRSFDARDVELLLSRPVGRIEFLLSYSLAFSILAVGMALAQGLCLFILGPYSFGAGHLAWILSIAAENIIMVNTALFFSMILTSAATAAMATAGLYVLSRMMGQLLGIMDAHLMAGSPAKFLELPMKGVSVVLPRLDLMGQTSWLIYPESVLSFNVILFQGAAFVFLVVLASIVDLVRRQF
ncbi:MAG: hypothetical protein WBK77_04025 [Alphaproteobacteria bacterium]